jgi:hypothetical protein
MFYPEKEGKQFVLSKMFYPLSLFDFVLSEVGPSSFPKWHILCFSSPSTSASYIILSTLHKDKKNMPTVWETAKEKLTKEITEGRLLDSVPPLSVWPTEPEYQKVPVENFKQNLAALRERLGNFRISAEYDDSGLRSDRLHHPIELEGRWPGSEAERLLKEDIDDGKHLTMTASQLYNDPFRQPYREFGPTQFRKHIHQEVRSRKDSLYWTQRRCPPNKRLGCRLRCCLRCGAPPQDTGPATRGRDRRQTDTSSGRKSERDESPALLPDPMNLSSMSDQRAEGQSERS